VPEAANPLTIEFLAWIASRPRTYAETMEAWRSNCPRHPVWDDAVSDGLVQMLPGAGPARQEIVALTLKGKTLLERSP
jgi:hypothetical protein